MLQVISLSFILAYSGSLNFTPQEIPAQQIETTAVLPATTEEVTRIYFIHNAESEYSAEDQDGMKFTSGRSPEVPLSERGRNQADRLGTLLSSRIDEAVVFLPPAERAKETVTPFLSDTIVIDSYREGLFEVSMGAWEGKPKDQAYQNEYQAWKDLSAVDKYITPKVTGGESYNEAAHRAMEELENILQSNSEKTIFVVSGENLLNALAIHWMNPSLSEEPGSDVPMLPMEKGDLFLVEVPHGQSIEQAEVKLLFHIGQGERIKC